MDNQTSINAFHELYICSKEIMKQISKLKSNKEKCLGFLCAQGILIRLSSTFHSIELLGKNGYAIEIFVLERFLLEQIAYAHTIYSLNNPGDIDSLSVSKCIKMYKNDKEESGKFYGELTKYSHMSTEKINTYMDFDLYYKNGVGINLEHSNDKDIINQALFSICYLLLQYLDMMFLLYQAGKWNNKKCENTMEKLKIKTYVIVDMIFEENKTKNA